MARKKTVQLAERFRSELVGHDDVRWAVAFEHTMRYEPIRSSLGLDLLGSFAEDQGFGLGKDVGQEHVVMASQGIEGFVEPNEVAGDEPGSLVNQLVKSVLAVSPRFAPDDWTG